MDIFEKISFFWNADGVVKGLIEQWSPAGCLSEKDCEDSLYAFLHQKLDDVQIVRQYGRGRAHVDLMINDSIMVELKYGLSSTSEYQRLIGQLIDYKGWGKNIIIVLVGKTEPGLLKDLKKFVSREFGSFLLDSSANIIEKATTVS